MGQNGHCQSGHCQSGHCQSGHCQNGHSTGNFWNHKNAWPVGTFYFEPDYERFTRCVRRIFFGNKMPLIILVNSNLSALDQIKIMFLLAHNWGYQPLDGVEMGSIPPEFLGLIFDSIKISHFF